MEDDGTSCACTGVFSFHKPRKKMRSHGHDVAVAVGIGGLGIIRLRIGVTQATVNSCMQFGELLKSMYKDFEANSRQLSPSRKILVESHPPELRQRLFNIFGQRTPSFPGLSDGRFNRKSSRSRRSSDASIHRRSSDASIHKPYFDITLKKELEDAITDLVYAKDLDIKDVAQVDSFLSSSEMTAKVFMRGDRNARISLIQDMLKR